MPHSFQVENFWTFGVWKTLVNDVTKFKGHRAIYLEKVWTRKALFSIKITTSKNNYQFFGQIFIIPNKTV